jgi:hypothetical protein
VRLRRLSCSRSACFSSGSRSRYCASAFTRSHRPSSGGSWGRNRRWTPGVPRRGDRSMAGASSDSSSSDAASALHGRRPSPRLQAPTPRSPAGALCRVLFEDAKRSTPRRTMLCRPSGSDPRALTPLQPSRYGRTSSCCQPGRNSTMQICDRRECVGRHLAITGLEDGSGRNIRGRARRSAAKIGSSSDMRTVNLERTLNLEP